MALSSSNLPVRLVYGSRLQAFALAFYSRRSEQAAARLSAISQHSGADQV